MEGKVIPKEIVDKAERELKQNYREIKTQFKDVEDFTVRIYLPNVDVQTKLADYYAEEYNKILMSKSEIVPKKKMEQILLDKGVWTKIDEDKINSLRTQHTNIEVELLKERGKHKPSKKRIEGLKLEYESSKTNLIEKIMEKETFLSQTVEARAESKAEVLKMVLCIKDSEDKQLWDTIDDVGKETNTSGIINIMTEARYFWGGLSREVLELLPEKLFDVSSGANDSENSQEAKSGKKSTQ